MTNQLKNNLNRAKPTPGEGVAPSGIDEYAKWFNQTFTFAKAIVRIDQRGVKFLDLDYRK